MPPLQTPSGALCFDELNQLLDRECERLVALTPKRATVQDQKALITLVYQWLINYGLLREAPHLLGLSAPYYGMQTPLALCDYGPGSSWPTDKLRSKLEEAKQCVREAVEKDKTAYRANLVERLASMQEDLALFDLKHQPPK